MAPEGHVMVAMVIGAKFGLFNGCSPRADETLHYSNKRLLSNWVQICLGLEVSKTLAVTKTFTCWFARANLAETFWICNMHSLKYNILKQR